MSAVSLLYQKQYMINDDIGIIIPSVGEVLDNESEYFSLVTIFTATPIDLMVQLDDAGIDYTKINEWDLFLIFFEGLKSRDTSLILGNLDLKNFVPMVNEEKMTIVLYDKEKGIVIDRKMHQIIASTLRKIHHLKKNRRKPANDEVKKYMLERERLKQSRKKSNEVKSDLEQLIVALVNTSEFKYNFETIRDISIYQFNESLAQVAKKVSYDNLMHGVYAGMIDIKGLSQDELNWMTHK